MNMQVLVLVLACLMVASAEVKLDETFVPFDEVAAAPQEEDPARVLEELEHAIFDEVAAKEEAEAEAEVGLNLPLPQPPQQQQQQHEVPRARSPKKCCKLGRQVAANGLYCSADLMQVAKRPNVVHRRKMKFHGAEVHGKTAYKDLMRRVEKCSLAGASRSMFVKCCQWQELIQRELESCRELATQEERRECRRVVQSRE